MSDDVELLRRIYTLFNARDIESVLAAMHPDVVLANGMEGGHVHGCDEVRSYGKRQWAIVDPHVEPIEISSNGKEGVLSEFIRWCVTLRQSPGRQTDDPRLPGAKRVDPAFRYPRCIVKREAEVA